MQLNGRAQCVDVRDKTGALLVLRELQQRLRRFHLSKRGIASRLCIENEKIRRADDQHDRFTRVVCIESRRFDARASGATALPGAEGQRFVERRP